MRVQRPLFCSCLSLAGGLCLGSLIQTALPSPGVLEPVASPRGSLTANSAPFCAVIPAAVRSQSAHIFKDPASQLGQPWSCVYTAGASKRSCGSDQASLPSWKVLDFPENTSNGKNATLGGLQAKKMLLLCCQIPHPQGALWCEPTQRWECQPVAERSWYSLRDVVWRGTFPRTKFLAWNPNLLWGSGGECHS